MWTVWKGAQQMVNSRTIVIIIFTALFFFLWKMKQVKKFLKSRRSKIPQNLAILPGDMTLRRTSAVQPTSRSY